MTDAARAAHEEWKTGRLAQVSGPVGHLALVGYHPVGLEAEEVEGLPVLARRAPGEEGVWVCPQDDARVDIDGEIDTEAAVGWTFLGRLTVRGSPLLRHGRRTADAFSLDGTDYELRIYDADSEGLANFAGIQTYDHDPALVVTGVFERHPDIALVPWDFTRASDAGHVKRVPGLLEVEVAGERRALIAFLDSGQLVLVFSDGTTGTESYPPGRFLRLEPPAEGVREVEVDFNRAFIPPCGFSDFYSCPIPPAENRFTVPVRAGEQRVLWRRPRY